VKRNLWAIGALALLGALVIAGCGGGSSSSSASGSTGTGGETAATSTTSSNTSAGRYGGGESVQEEGGEAATAAAASGAAVVKVMKTDLGEVITDAEGMTMYDFHKDKGTTSSCYGACAEAWPPLLTEGKPTAAGGAEASLIGVTKRKDGTEQVTYAGHPLYGFVEDQKPGETNGNDVSGFGAQWYALEPGGKEPGDG
jgi:predicted lipoprotein with Yx(FWY)xxD motif